MTTRTRTKSAGVDFPHVENYANRRNKVSWASPPSMSNKYYAGAKFDTIPSLSDLPTPPRHWTDPSARSQSTPSSPVTIATKPSAGVSLDIASLFSPLAPVSCDKSRREVGGVVKSASLPQSGMMNMVGKKQGSLNIDKPAVFKTPENVKARPAVKLLTKPKVTKDYGSAKPSRATPVKAIPVASNANEGKSTNVGGSKVNGHTEGITGLDLMEMLLRASPTHRQDFNSTPDVKTPVVKLSSPCHLQLSSTGSQYKDISDRLKSILNVSA